MAANFWEEMRRVQRRMDEAFEDFFSDEPFMEARPLLRSGGKPAPAENLATPKADFWESDNAFNAEIDLPGIDRKDIKLAITKSRVEIRAEKKHEKKEDRKGRYRLERSYEGYYRGFSLPESADAENAQAKYENGVLKLSIPKKALPEYKPKAIDVK